MKIPMGLSIWFRHLATTGENKNFTSDFENFAGRLKAMNLKNPLITGFGIKDKKSFDQVCQFSKGGIIGSAFVKGDRRDSGG